jgi:hypothetical protein
MDTYFYYFTIDKDNGILPFYYSDKEYPGLNKNTCRARRHEIYHYYFKNYIKDVSIKDTLVGIGTPSVNLENVISNLHRFEDIVGIRRSKIEKFENGGSPLTPDCVQYKVTGSYWWGIAPPIHSLYTLLIRLLVRIEQNISGKVFNIGEDDLDFIITNDKAEYDRIKSRILPLMKNVKKIFPKNKKENYVYSTNESAQGNIHNFGIEIFMRDSPPAYFLKEERDKIKELQDKFKEVLDFHQK